jgi:hypothetical protein
MRAAIASGVLAIGVLAAPAWALKKVPYPEVPVTALPAFAGDPALAEMRKQLAAAAAAEDLEATVKFLAPEFTGPRATGRPTSSTPSAMPSTISRSHSASVPSAATPTERPTSARNGVCSLLCKGRGADSGKGSPLVCGSTTAKVADLGALDEAFDRIDEEDDISEWVYFLGELELTAKPGAGAAVAKLRNLALPIVGLHPAPQSDTAQAAAPTHFELLLPTGKTGGRR